MSRKTRKRRLISELMETNSSSDGEDVSPRGEPPEFFIHSSNSDFNARQRDVFTGLNQLEKMHAQFSNVPAPVDDDDDNNNDNDDDVDKELSEVTKPIMDGQFKRPSLIPKRHGNRNNASPDYIVHPERWIKYSLSDVGSEQLTEKSNTAAAMSFLNECKKRKVMPESPEDDPVMDEERSERSQGKIIFRSRKFVMPEYTVGQNVTPKKTKPVSMPSEIAASSRPSSNAVHLSHLEDEIERHEDHSDAPLETTMEMESDEPGDATKMEQNVSATVKPKRSLRKCSDDDDVIL